MTTATATQPRTAGAAPATVTRPVTRQEADTARKALAKLEATGRLITKALVTIGAGALIFTCVNVTLFAVQHQVSPWIAWMLDPLASIALLTVLYVDGALAEQGYKPNGWPLAMRWFAGLSTWVMNCWESLYPDGQFHLPPQHPDAGGMLLHSVAPMLVIVLSEASSGYRKYLVRKTGECRKTIQAFEDTERLAREAEAQRVREERERAEERARYEAREAARLAREREDRAAEIEVRRVEAEAEIERERIRAQREIEARELDARLEREREERDEQRRIREAQIEAERMEREAKIEAERQAREAEAERVRLEMEAQAKAREEAERQAREAAARQEAERLAKQAQRAAAKASQTSSISARIPSRSTSQAGSRTGSNSASQNGTVPREVRALMREQAEREAANFILADAPITAKALADKYGNNETWGGDRIRAAKRRLAEEDGFKESVLATEHHFASASAN